MWSRDALARAASGAIALAIVAGCSKRKAECKRVIDVIDADDDKIAQLAGNKGSEPEEIARTMRDVATVCEQLAKDLDALPITTSELASCAHDYQGFSRELAASLRGYASSLDKVNDRSERGLRGRMATAAKNMGVRCGAASPPVECAQLRPKVQKALQEPGKDAAAYAERLEVSIVDIGKLTIADADLSAGVAEALAVLKELATMARAEAAYGIESDRLRATERQLTQKILQVCGNRR